MAMKWFRVYSEILEDRKVQELSPATFRLWILMLALANTGEKRGRLPPVPDIAFRLRAGLDEMTAVIDELRDGGFLCEEEGALMPHNWDIRQPFRDLSGTARAQAGHAEGTQKARRQARKSAQKARLDKDLEVDRDRDREEDLAAAAAIPDPPEVDNSSLPGKEDTSLTKAAREESPATAAQLYEAAFSKPVPNQVIADELVDWLDTSGEECLSHCLVEAAMVGARSWRYAEAILRRHQEEGCEQEAVKAAWTEPNDGATDWLRRRYAAQKGAAA